eukprot:TRINITY_DN4869_c0_g1_i1.p1 TRINITY_DN4869_c0_g1~~TRINITY_DN4869_c0_g1_i1.p1  ORF type:complete len:1392 (+),score=293.48 TRINITY_DN4869_c0_g1_i1:62-4177(+)
MLQGTTKVLALLLLRGVLSLPRPFSVYETGEPSGPHHPPGVRNFRHREDHELEDGSEFSLHWDVDVDPETLLELDLEHRNGAQMVDCGHDHLVLQLHGEALQRLDRLRHVTASSLLHGCRHLQGENLYHRIENVNKVSPLSGSDSGTIVEFHTKELETAHEVFPSIKLFIHSMPAGAQDPEVLARKLLTKRQQAEQPQPKESGERQLAGIFDMMKSAMGNIGEVHGGNLNFQSGMQPDDANDNQQNSFFNLASPQEQDHFHWNWNYKANSTENPQYKYTFPGATAWLRLFKPYIDSNVGFSMNLSSHIPELMQPPHVLTDALVQSVSDMDLDVGMAADFTKDESSSVLDNVLDTFPIPILSKIKADTEQFMRPMVFHVGATPVSVEPGWSMNMKIFHIGRMKGTMRVGLKTKMLTQGLSHFDTTFGEQHNFSARMLNVSFTPPTWLLFTQAFQLGVELAPSMWIKGDFGSMKGMEMGFGMRPYFNVSVIQENPDGTGVTDLAIYPYRAVGLPMGKNYAVKITANGQYKITATQMSTGVIEFQNKVSNFDFGPMAQEDLIKSPIQVDILENGQEPPVATGTATCSEITAGVCTPSPLEARMTLDGQPVLVHLLGVFESNSLSALEAKMESVSVRFPMVTLNPGTSSQSISQMITSPANAGQTYLQLYHNGHTFRAKLVPKIGNMPNVMKSDDIWELGPSFLDAWKNGGYLPTSTSDLTAARLKSMVQLVVNGKVVATGELQPLSFQEEKPVTSVEDLDSEETSSVQPVPAQVVLNSVGDKPVMIGSAQIELDLMPPDYGAFWVQPFEAGTFATGTPYTFAWTTHGAVLGSYYAFNLSILEVASNGVLSAPTWQKELEVNCTENTEIPVHRYYGGGTPSCLFEYQLVAPASVAGKNVIVIASWTDALDLPHYMPSAPITFNTTTSGGRRLQAATANATTANNVGFGFESMGHKEGFSPQAKKAFKELQSHCSAQPLKYSAGAGMNYVQLMKNVMMGGAMMNAMSGAMSGMSGMAGGMGGMGGGSPMAQAPGTGTFNANGDYISKPYPVWRLGQGENGQEISNLLPKSVCVEGVCNGMLPGCQSTKVNPIDIPRIVYKFSRTFNWIPHVGPSARHIIAYGLMLMPTALKSGAAEAQQVMQEQNVTGVQPLGALGMGNIFQPPPGTQQGRRLHGASVETESGGEFKEETLEDIEDEADWTMNGAHDELTVEITDDMNYRITDDVMRYLLESDAFRGLEDGREATHGPVRIVGYQLLDTPRNAALKARYGLPALANFEKRSPQALNAKRRKKAQEAAVPDLSEASALWEESSIERSELRTGKFSTSTRSGALFGIMALAALLAVASFAALAATRRRGCEQWYERVSRSESSVTSAA